MSENETTGPAGEDLLDLASALLDEPPTDVWSDALAEALASEADPAALLDLLPDEAGAAGADDVVDVLEIPDDAGDDLDDGTDAGADGGTGAADAGATTATDEAGAAAEDDVLDAAEDLEAPAYDTTGLGADDLDDVLDTLDLDAGYDA